MELTRPSLTEPGVHLALKTSLKKCGEFKTRYFNVLFNVGMIFVFGCILGGILVYKYKGKLTKQEIEIRNKREQEYIIEKVQQLSALNAINDDFRI
jgi:hypothetical protein